MEWNIAPEFVSLLIIFILMVYAQEYNLLPTLKNRMFRFCLNFVFVEIQISILSIFAIQYYRSISEPLNQFIQTVYFLASPMIAVLFLFYLIAVILEGTPRIGVRFLIASIPYALYAVLVCVNPATAFLYFFTAADGFVFGAAFWLVYAIPALYMIGMIVFIFIYRRKLERPMPLVLVSFPAISLLMLVVQWVFPLVVLSGSGAAAALLILYLYLQNKQIVIDDLTGLQNRKAFSKILALRTERKTKMDILMVSLDDFRVINNRFGQTTGDHFIRAVAHFLAKVASIKSIYRYGGDEFIVIVHPEKRIRSGEVVKAIQDRFGDCWRDGEFQTLLSASIAVVKSPDHADTVEEIIALLEYCIDQSKRNGKGRTVFADPLTVDKLKRKNRIIERMKAGINKAVFKVVYQPIYSRRDHRFTTAEALLRFTDGEMGVISPSEFIPIAEEAGLIDEIGLMVLDKVCKFIRDLDDKNTPIDAISINISTLHLNAESFVGDCLRIIRENGVDPRKLRMEVTESVFIDKDEHVDRVLRRLNDQGVQFYMDDFGTGYANLANIISLPFECIKFDKSFLYEAISDPRCHSVLKGLCVAFTEVGMKVVLEGVENMEQMRLAEDIDVDFVQGFLFAKPMPPADAVAYLGKDLADTDARSALDVK